MSKNWMRVYGGVLWLCTRWVKATISKQFQMWVPTALSKNIRSSTSKEYSWQQIVVPLVRKKNTAWDYRQSEEHDYDYAEDPWQIWCHYTKADISTDTAQMGFTYLLTKKVFN